MQTLTLLGATGSIGQSTLDVVRRHPQRFRIHALTAHAQVDRLFDQCMEFAPRLAVLGSEEGARQLADRLSAAGSTTQVSWGPDALAQVAAAPEVDTVMAAIVGAAGLAPTLAAVRNSKKVLLANKESLVMAGALFMAEVAAHGATLLPIDSEHNAIFQSLPDHFSRNIEECGIHQILLTASGGPFRHTALEDLEQVTPQQACAHPNWAMGRKISVDSATMMNKGLEVIEAHWLFGVAPQHIQVVIHPQSIIHSMVSYSDGSVIAQLGNPDMRTPIAHALAYPERIESGVAPLDFFALGALQFEPPDLHRFPCLALAYRALSLGGAAAAVLNAANEVAVAAFLEGALPFLRISAVNRQVLDTLAALPADTLADVLFADTEARSMAQRLI